MHCADIYGRERQVKAITSVVTYVYVHTSHSFINKFRNPHFFLYAYGIFLTPRDTFLYQYLSLDYRFLLWDDQTTRPSDSDVQSCQQKSIGLKFSKSKTGNDVRYSCHHNSSRFTFPIFAHACRFSVLHSLQSITPRIY